MIAAVRRQQACFSGTARHNPPVRKAIDAIAEDALDADQVHQRGLGRGRSGVDQRRRGRPDRLHRFSSMAKDKQVTSRLIVRRSRT